jgi:hypothetical protein
MTRILLTLLCSVLIAVAGCDDSSKSDNGSGSDSQAGNGGDGPSGEVVLAYTVPDDWEVTERPGSFVLSTAMSPADADGVRANLTLMYNSLLLMPDKTLKGCADKHLSGLKGSSQLKNLKVVKNEPVKVGKVDAQEIIYTSDSYAGVDMAYKVRMWIVLSKDHVYYLTSGNTLKAFDTIDPVLDKVVATLRWEKGSPDPDEE